MISKSTSLVILSLLMAGAAALGGCKTLEEANRTGNDLLDFDKQLGN